ncbi:hypothetical protein LCGC14_2758260, partial [marine sediment metagenome]
MFLSILLLTFAVAFEIDNVKFERDTTFDGIKTQDNQLLQKYKPIEIKNSFGFGATLFEGYLSDHDSFCEMDCSSTIQIRLGSDGVLIDEIIFKELQPSGSWLEKSIIDYQIYANGKLYIPGTSIKEGDYTVVIKGIKPFDKTIDWIIKTNGEWLYDWAVWGGSGELLINLSSYYRLDNSSGVVFDMQGNFDASNEGATRGVPGIINTAFNFSSANITDAADTRGWANGTINLWINTTTIIGVQDFYSTQGGGTDSSIGTSGNKLAFNRQGEWFFTSTSSVVINTWVMATFVWNTTGEFIYF